MTPTIYYCYDAYCGWCYGFSTVIKKLYEKYSENIFFETLSGNMIPIEFAHPIGRTAAYILSAYKVVEERTGIKFGGDYLWHIQNPDLSDWVPHSEKAAIAMVVFKDYHPGKTVLFAADLQYALHYEGRDLTDDEAYRHLLSSYRIPEIEFYKRLHDDTYREKAYYEFALVKQLHVTGFPAVFLQTAPQKFFLLSRGYTEYDTLQTRLENVLKDTDAEKSATS